MTTNLVIIGTSGNGREIIDLVQQINLKTPGKYALLGFLDDAPSCSDKELCSVPLIGKLSKARQITDAKFIFAIGSTNNYFERHKICASLDLDPNAFETLIHPSVSVSFSSKIGMGSVLFQNVVVGNQVQIGTSVIVLPNSVLSHDVVLGSYTCVAAGVCLSGGVRVGENCYLGSRSVIRENVRIGAGSLIGMGAVVLKDIPQKSCWVGNPARELDSF